MLCISAREPSSWHWRMYGFSSLMLLLMDHLIFLCMYSTYVGIWISMCTVRGTYMHNIYICGIEHIVAWRRGYIYTAILLRTPLFHNKHASDTPYYGIIPVSSRLRLLIILPGRFNTPLRDLIHTYEVHTIYTVLCPYVLEYSVDISTAELEKKKKKAPTQLVPVIHGQDRDIKKLCSPAIWHNRADWKGYSIA